MVFRGFGFLFLAFLVVLCFGRWVLGCVVEMRIFFEFRWRIWIGGVRFGYFF